MATYVVDPILRSPVGYDGLARLGDTLPPTLEVTLHRSNDLVTPVATLDRARNRRFQEQLNGPGSASLVVQHDDAVVAEVAAGADVLRWSVHGRVVFASLIRDAEHVPVAAGEEAEQTTTLSGPGSLAYLDTAVVYPAAPLRAQATDVPVQEDRLFGWTAVDYDDSGWSTAQVLAGVLDDTPAWHGMRSGWTGALASWIGPSSGTVRLAPGGSCYLRRRFRVDGDGMASLVILFAADDGAVVHLDGAQIGESEPWANLPTNVYTANANVSAGEDHTLAVRVDNSTAGPAIIDGQPFNPTGFVCAVHRTGSDGSLGPAVVVSDDSWRIVEYPPQAPGLTPGAVLRIVVDEAQQRGALTGLSLAFDDDADSAGEPWDAAEIATKIGTDLLTFVTELTGSYIDVWMEPAAWRLWAWRRDGRGTRRPVTLRPVADPTDPTSGSLRALSHREAR